MFMRHAGTLWEDTVARLRIPDEVAATLREFYTCEVTTVNRQGQPITWPALTYFDEPGGRLILSVSIAFPVKAQNARRHPQVSLLYSDSMGCGLADPVAALVQGEASVVEGVDPLASEMRALAAVAARRQPDSSQFSANPIARRLFAWYLFQRLLITVTPQRLLVWPHRDFSQQPTIIALTPAEDDARGPASVLAATPVAFVASGKSNVTDSDDLSAPQKQMEASDVE